MPWQVVPLPPLKNVQLGLKFPPEGNVEGHALSLPLYNKDDLMKQEGDKWPLIIRLETAVESKCEGRTLNDLKEGSQQPPWVQSQTTFAVLSYVGGGWSAKVIRQKIWVDSVSYELQVWTPTPCGQMQLLISPVTRVGDCLCFCGPISPKLCNQLPWIHPHDPPPFLFIQVLPFRSALQDFCLSSFCEYISCSNGRKPFQAVVNTGRAPARQPPRSQQHWKLLT